MAFVPEGQADSSQARSAWVAMQRGLVPEGRLKSLSVPRIFVVETEPRNEQATAHRMLIPLQKRQVLLLKSSGPMMFVPGYYRAVPLGQKPSAHRSAAQLS
jgi:hypothetical protein